MKISIVTPSYNQGEFIRDAIESVIAQNYVEFEHIIIDNCSTDNTLNVLADYKHLIVISEPDKGQSDALNKGFLLATGEVFGWLNADDIYTENVFTSVKKHIYNSRYDAVYSNFYFVNKKMEIVKKQLSHISLKWLSVFHCYIPSTTFFFKKNIYNDTIRIKASFHICMDKDFFANILYHKFKIKFINEFWAKFRLHETNKSNETLEVKKIRYSEGLKIFNTYFFNIGNSRLSQIFYIFMLNMLLPLRYSLKKISKWV